jgi:hypothetical protein
MFIKLKVYKVEVKLGARFFGIYKVLMRPEMVLEISMALSNKRSHSVLET